jgi:hypothetical protein
MESDCFCRKKIKNYSKMSMPRELFEKYATEVQGNIVEQTKRLNVQKASLAHNTKTQKLSLLTLKELESCGACKTYKSVGKMYIL